MKNDLKGIWLVFLMIILVGCNIENNAEPNLILKGYILEVNQGRLLIAEDITKEEFDKIRDMTIKEIQDIEEKMIMLTYVSFTNVETFNVGDFVKVTVDGGINHSYPGQAGAKKIEIVE
ncbi:hypothetical protein GCM10008967_31690 [Bacillus carboniphilus]|uniref:DUF3221 domain-containing protein n=2 Tax=Bacillus carboniphilus TaxID=86663 RepID=A0ABN0WIV2_9BACI